MHFHRAVTNVNQHYVRNGLFCSAFFIQANHGHIFMTSWVVVPPPTYSAAASPNWHQLDAALVFASWSPHSSSTKTLSFCLRHLHGNVSINHANYVGRARKESHAWITIGLHRSGKAHVEGLEAFWKQAAMVVDTSQTSSRLCRPSLWSLVGEGAAKRRTSNSLRLIAWRRSFTWSELTTQKIDFVVGCSVQNSKHASQIFTSIWIFHHQLLKGRPPAVKNLFAGKQTEDLGYGEHHKSLLERTFDVLSNTCAKQATKGWSTRRIPPNDQSWVCGARTACKIRVGNWIPHQHTHGTPSHRGHRNGTASAAMPKRIAARLSNSAGAKSWCSPFQIQDKNVIPTCCLFLHPPTATKLIEVTWITKYHWP